MDEQFWQWWEQNGSINQQNEINELQVLLNQSSNQQYLQIERDHERTMDSINADKNETEEQIRKRKVQLYFKKADKLINFIAEKSVQMLNQAEERIGGTNQFEKYFYKFAVEQGRLTLNCKSALLCAGISQETKLKLQQKSNQILLQISKFNEIYCELFEEANEAGEEGNDQQNEFANVEIGESHQNLTAKNIEEIPQQIQLSNSEKKIDKQEEKISQHLPPSSSRHQGESESKTSIKIEIKQQKLTKYLFRYTDSVTYIDDKAERSAEGSGKEDKPKQAKQKGKK